LGLGKGLGAPTAIRGTSVLLMCSCSLPLLLRTDTPVLIACREWLPFSSNCRGALDKGSSRGGGGEGRQ
jgi:hypothetical protein